MKRILITGATGNIGKSLTNYLASKDYRIILAARNEQKLASLANSLKDQNSQIDYTALDYLDIATFANIKKLCEKGLDGLVLITPRIPASEHCFPEDDVWETLFNLTFIKPLALIKTLIDELNKSERAKIVIISGLTSVQYLSNYAVNGAIRAAWLAQAKAMAFQYGAQQIHVNTLSLGGIMTETFQDKLQQESRDENIPYDILLKQRTENIPLKKYASLLEVSQTIECLLSTMTDHMTGMNFFCDGGFIKHY